MKGVVVAAVRTLHPGLHWTGMAIASLIGQHPRCLSVAVIFASAVNVGP